MEQSKQELSLALGQINASMLEILVNIKFSNPGLVDLMLDKIREDLKGEAVEKLYDYKAFCKVIPITKNTFWRYVREGIIPTIQLGKSKYVKQSVIDSILENGITQ